VSDHNPGSELDLDAVLRRVDDEGSIGFATTHALVAEVRRLRAQVAEWEGLQPYLTGEK
jgi:hypothetical protein